MDISIFNILIIFIFGTIVGSFINVLALRFNSGISFTYSRSKCFICNTELKWYELIPIFSFLIQKGRCRNCKAKISYQYPLIEVLTGLIFVGVYLRQVSLLPLYNTLDNGVIYLALLSVYYFVIFSILLTITIYDYRHKIIPNAFAYLFIILSFLKLSLFVYIKYPYLGREDMFDLLSPFILFGSFGLLWVISRGRWIGFGDVKLIFGIGSLLGFVYGLGAVVVSFWIGAIWSIILLINYKLLNRGYINMKSEIPFAPFLVAGTILIFITRFDILNVSSFFGN